MVLTSMKGVAYPIVPSMLAIRPEPLQTRLLDPPAVMIAAASLLGLEEEARVELGHALVSLLRVKLWACVSINFNVYRLTQEIIADTLI
jgi:hypothetical protein